MFSNNSLQHVNLSKINIIDYSCNNEFNNKYNLKDNNLLVVSPKYEIRLYSTYNLEPYKLLPGWTIEEFFHFQKMLKEHTVNRWQEIRKNKLDTHKFSEYINLYKYIQSQVKINIKLREKTHDVNDFCNNKFYKIHDDDSFINNLQLHNNLILINLDSNVDISSNKKLHNYENSYVLFIGLDKLIKNGNIKPEEIYIKMLNLLKYYNLNNLDNKLIFFSDEKLTWGFTINTFAKLYNEQFELTVEETIYKLWGDNYYDSKKMMWLDFKKSDIKRSFCQYILIPLKQLHNSIILNNTSRINEILDFFRIDICKFNNNFELNEFLCELTPFNLNFGKFIYNNI